MKAELLWEIRIICLNPPNNGNQFWIIANVNLHQEHSIGLILESSLKVHKYGVSSFIFQNLLH